VCYKCGKPGHFIAKCPLSSDSDRGDDKKGKRREKKRYYKKKGGDSMFAGSGTPTRTPPTSPSTKGSSSPTLATNASWQRTEKRRR
jgi:hypothetical protein